MKPSADSMLIKGVRLLDPASDSDSIGCIGIRDGRIDYRGLRAPTAKHAAYAETIEAKGLWLMPGAIDLCARLREPGATQKGTMRSEAGAALAAGITAVCIPSRSSTTRPWSTASTVLRRPQLELTSTCSAR
jgi:dihydroorotase